ncbi:2-aminoadipate transaminase [Caprobacter fermentans]|uniref:2-aminoadipate transaminase n=1 Tax=Caproicibacter fermentans TaxID=2576756 RepID=A0A6N8HWA3_9FIRM|nr:PLP-dependent aminotransferase family protein [Caproicibacter fermentans]MVB10081.1 2-aminoadipate transaminase [Caproicibacter fermentans]OCN03349.1 GntR family transcriptional regulator [Clostridium sp. W14A]QNK40155.1 PLP-dependent aminotransferase family protein [Caproicibacter fermentans]
MEYQFSRRVLELKPSAIREIFKYAADPQVISLSAGNPAPEAFPVREIAEISAGILAQRPIDALQYGTTEGYTPLRGHLAAYLKETSGIGSDGDDLIITSGAQQIMDLFTKSVVDEEDTIVCEAPSFLGALNTYRSYRAKLRGVPMESDGISLEGLEQALKEEKRVKFIYTIPNFQNPTGATMSLAKRHGMYELAKKYGVMILEDNPYGDLRFQGEDLPAIKSFDTEGIVLYSGTFSKVVAPGIRVGYAVGPKPILQKMIVCKQGEDVHTNIWGQMLCDELMTKYDFGAHLARLREVYRKKSKVAVDAMNRWLLPKITYLPIEGGLFFWCTLPNGIDMLEFVKRAIDHKVCVVPGNAFLTDESKPCQSFRINYTTPTDENLVRGIQLLGEVASDMIP